MMKMNRFSWRQFLPFAFYLLLAWIVDSIPANGITILWQEEQKPQVQREAWQKHKKSAMPVVWWNHHHSYAVPTLGLTVRGNTTIRVNFRQLNPILTDGYVTRVNMWVMHVTAPNKYFKFSEHYLISFISYNSPYWNKWQCLLFQIQIRNVGNLEIHGCVCTRITHRHSLVCTEFALNLLHSTTISIQYH